MAKDGACSREDCEIGCSCLAPVVRAGAWVVRKTLTILDPEHLWTLRNRGQYKKVDKFAIFYGTLSLRLPPYLFRTARSIPFGTLLV